MQRAARQRLKSVFRENGKSYAKAALSFGVGLDGKPVINRGTIYAILNLGERASKRVLERLGIVKKKRYYRNYRYRELMLRRWIRKHETQSK